MYRKGRVPSRPTTSLPQRAVTFTSAHPRLGDTGEVTVISVLELACTGAASPAPKSTSLTPPRFDPVNVTVVPPAAGPDEVDMEVTTGQASGGERRRLTSTLVTGDPSPDARS